MRNFKSHKGFFPFATSLLSLLLFSLAACGNSPGSGSGSGTNGTSHTQIDWVNFVRFHSITYLATLTAKPEKLSSASLGPIFAHVDFTLEGHVYDPSYHIKDGDAAFLASGTAVFTLKDYAPTFRLAIVTHNTVQLYEADSNPQARVGKDLLDISGKVLSLDILSAQDGTTHLGAIHAPGQITDLERMIAQAPVDQTTTGSSSPSYRLVLHLRDGTTVERNYWPDTGELSRGILLPPAFKTIIEAAIRQ